MCRCENYAQPSGVFKIFLNNFGHQGLVEGSIPESMTWGTRLMMFRCVQGKIGGSSEDNGGALGAPSVQWSQVECQGRAERSGIEWSIVEWSTGATS